MSAAASPATPRPERVLSRPLAAFLALVALALVGSWWSRQQPADLPAAVRELADGDRDGHERRPLLQAVLREATGRRDALGSWVARLAAVALDDAAGWQRALAAHGGQLLPGDPLPTDLAPWQSLGDPLVGNTAAALQREQQGDRAGARAAWARVAAQAQLTGHALGAELAAAAATRLK